MEAILAFEWKRQEHIQREIHFQSGLVLTALAGLSWMASRLTFREPLERIISSNGTGASSVIFADVMHIAPLTLAGFSIAVQCGWIMLALARAKYLFLPSADDLLLVYVSTVRVSRSESGVTHFDESGFVDQLRPAQAQMATANFRQNNRRQAYLTRAYWSFFFTVSSLVCAGVFCLTMWEALPYLHAASALVAAIVATRTWWPVPAEEDSATKLSAAGLLRSGAGVTPATAPRGDPTNAAT
ncbi:MAG: hypothetical protein JNN27_13180 [Planctomycetes bacterium]|nr:hypothetical protein [Planctomycetota bacterium]